VGRFQLVLIEGLLSLMRTSTGDGQQATGNVGERPFCSGRSERVLFQQRHGAF